jgi:hypothetical protein
MRKLTLYPALTAAAMLATSGAWAAQCEGIGARKSGKPVIIQKADDGAMTMLITSTGTNTILNPAEIAGAAWQHCSGFWTVNADKSGSGSGNCYSLDADGDQWIVSWQGSNAGGTWAHESGTGKFANQNGGGNWAYGAKFADGVGLTPWDGTCGD